MFAFESTDSSYYPLRARLVDVRTHRQAEYGFRQSFRQRKIAPAVTEASIRSGEMRRHRVVDRSLDAAGLEKKPQRFPIRVANDKEMPARFGPVGNDG
jgi:hypothetical protein